LSKIRFIKLYQLTIFSIITNLRENRLFASEWTVDEKKRAHNVKFCTKYFTTQRTYSHVNPKQNLKNKSAYTQYDTSNTHSARENEQHSNLPLVRTNKKEPWKRANNKPSGVYLTTKRLRRCACGYHKLALLRTTTHLMQIKKANRLAKQLMRKALTFCKPICLILSVWVLLPPRQTCANIPSP